LASAVAFGLVGFVLSSMQSDEYEASARLFLTSPGTTVVFDRQAFVPLERYLPQQAQRVTSGEVLTAAAASLDDGTSPAALAQQISVETNIELVTLTITASDASPERAAEVANAVSVAYQVSIRESGLERVNPAVEELEQSAADIEAQIEELSAEADADGALPPAWLARSASLRNGSSRSSPSASSCSSMLGCSAPASTSWRKPSHRGHRSRLDRVAPRSGQPS
jgi:uncharacterized protein involved in exopolysaccharide biosynthesis